MYKKYAPLAIILAFSFAIVQYRVEQTGIHIFRFFWWNLLLAIIPYLTSEALEGAVWKNILMGFITVLFLPNAPYMITDLFHLRARAEFPLWYDTMLIFWFAAVGVVLFYLALFNLEKAIGRHFNSWMTQLALALICLLNGFGIYLGRFLRFNSWDLMSNYDELAESVLDRVINSSIHTRTLGVTLLYGVTLFLGYWMIKLHKEARS